MLAALGESKSQRDEDPLGGGGRRGGGGSPSGEPRLDTVDPESLARAREAAKNDDYEWFMEFIESDSELTEKSTDVWVAETEEHSKSRGAETDENARWGRNSRGRGRAAEPAGRPGEGLGVMPGRSSRQQSASTSQVDEYYGAGGNNRDSQQRRPRGRRASPADDDFNNSGADGGRFYRSAPSAARGTGRDGTGRGQRGVRRAPVAADTAYDYDFDDEFEGEKGRGGWDYDPELTTGVAARRRGVDIGRVRSRASVAAQRLPLEDFEPEEVEEGGEGGEGRGDGDGGGGDGRSEGIDGTSAVSASSAADDGSATTEISPEKVHYVSIVCS